MLLALGHSSYFLSTVLVCCIRFAPAPLLFQTCASCVEKRSRMSERWEDRLQMALSIGQGWSTHCSLAATRTWNISQQRERLVCDTQCSSLCQNGSMQFSMLNITIQALSNRGFAVFIMMVDAFSMFGNLNGPVFVSPGKSISGHVVNWDGIGFRSNVLGHMYGLVSSIKDKNPMEWPLDHEKRSYQGLLQLFAHTEPRVIRVVDFRHDIKAWVESWTVGSWYNYYKDLSFWISWRNSSLAPSFYSREGLESLAFWKKICLPRHSLSFK